jgi:threonine dehydrogenase-like Zn-dependent dehydrogenase
VDDERAVLVGDALAPAWQASTASGVGPGRVVAVWGVGAIGLLAVACARSLRADRVLAVDDVPERLALAAALGAEPIDFDVERGDEGVLARTEGRGADVCIEAVGFEAKRGIFERVETVVGLGATPGRTLRESAVACALGGTIAVTGYFTSSVLAFPMGQVFRKGLRVVAGPASARAVMPKLFADVAAGRIDPSLVITHRSKLGEGPALYALAADHAEGCIKVVLAP